jgi:hypothetical protein
MARRSPRPATMRLMKLTPASRLTSQLDGPLDPLACDGDHYSRPMRFGGQYVAKALPMIQSRGTGPQ